MTDYILVMVLATFLDVQPIVDDKPYDYYEHQCGECFKGYIVTRGI